MTTTRFGAHLRPLREFQTFPELEQATHQALYRALDIGDLIAFAGAGVSSDFGYPMWGKLAGLVVDKVKSDTAIAEFDPPLSTVEKDYLKQVTPRRLAKGSPQYLGSVLDYCHRIYFRRECDGKFSRIVTNIFESHTAVKPDRETSIQALIERLQLRRFMTTNYDELIEKALLPELSRDGHAILDKAGERCPQINRLDSRTSELVSFALGVGDYRSGVLHLHGTMPKPKEDPDIVLTESQYQRQYASDHAAARDRRDAYRLLFTANSILFIGTGLEEDDILRPLRQFVSDEDISYRHRPWFALKPMLKSKMGEASEFFHRYYYRYGIRTIFSPHDTPDDIGPSLVRTLTTIQAGWFEYRRIRTAPPAARIPSFFQVTDAQNIEHRVVAHHANVYADDLVKRLLRPETETLRRLASGGRKSLLLLGHQGRGKGATGLEIACHKLLSGNETIGFFATTHFANDFLSIVDAARLHLIASAGVMGIDADLPSKDGQSVVQHFFAVLTKISADCFFVFGGIERLLRNLPYNLPGDDRSDPPAAAATREASGNQQLMRMLTRLRWGRSANPEISQFLSQVIAFHDRSGTPGPNTKRIVLTSSAVPDILVGRILPAKLSQVDFDADMVMPIEALIGDGQIAPFPANLIPTDPTVGKIRQHFDNVCRLARFNLYTTDALSHAIGMVCGARGSDIWRCLLWLQELEVDAGRLEQHHRAEEIIRAIVILLESHADRIGGDMIDGWKKLRTILETISRFTTPVEPEVLAIALEQSEPTRANWNAKTWEAVLKSILPVIHEKSRLVLVVRPASGAAGDRYTTHSLVRAAMLRRLRGRIERPAEIQQFGLSDFASEPAAVQPVTNNEAELTLRIVDEIARTVEKSPALRDDAVGMRSHIRGAYGVLRAGWSATGLGRLLTEPLTVGQAAPVYQHYHRRLTRLLNLVYEHDERHRDRVTDSPNLIRGSDRNAALYHDELGWLFNELGLVCYSQGAISDSYAFFRLGEQVNQQIEQESPGYRMIESKINLASVLIDRARLKQARELLIQAATFATTYRADTVDVMARIHGFLGLVAHLSGDSEKGLSFYKAAIDALAKQESWRGVSLFRRHRSDLLRGEGKIDDAKLDLVRAIAAAEAGFHPDLVHYCRVSEANLVRLEARTQANKRASVASLEPTLRFARSIGSAKLESDVYRIKGLIELDQSDFDASTRSALACLWISKAYGLRLRMMSSLELLGRLMRQKGDLDDARRTFRAVVRLGQEFEYQRPMEDADKALAELDRQED